MNQDDDSKLLVSCEQRISELSALLVESLQPYTPGPGEKLLRLSLVWRESLFHRVVDLANAALAMFKQHRLVPGCTLTRSLYETIANLYVFHMKATDAVKTQQLEEWCNCVVKGAWGDKEGMFNVDSPLQVLTSIKHLNKEFYGAEREYFHLCEYAHPNMKGGMGTYAKITISEYEVSFGTNPQDLRMGPFGLGDLDIILAIAKEIHDRHMAIEAALFETVRRNAKGLFID